MKADWDTFLKALAANLQPIDPPTATEIDAAVHYLIGTIQQPADSTVPVARTTPFSCPEYPPKLKGLRNNESKASHSASAFLSGEFYVWSAA